MTIRQLENWITGYEDYMENSETPNLYKTWTAISVICSCLGRKCWHSWDMDIYSNMYIVLVGPSGIRKGSAMYPARAIVDYSGVPIAADATTREALIRALNDCGQEILLDGATKAFKHSSLTIFSSELTVFLGQNNWQLISDLNDWYDCKDKWKYTTKNSGTDDITGVWVNLLGATTPEFLTSALPNDAIGGGLTARIVFVFADGKSKIVPAPFITPEMKEIMRKLLHDIDTIKDLQGQFEITKEFFECHTVWYLAGEENPPFTDNILEKYCQRRSQHLRKIAMAHSAARSNEMKLLVEDFRYAESLLNETEKFMPFVFSGRGRHPGAWIINQIQRMMETQQIVTFSKLIETFLMDATVDELKDYVKKLVMIKFLMVKKKGEDTVLILNPDWKRDVGGK